VNVLIQVLGMFGILGG